MESIICDVCGKQITDFDKDLFHHTGKLRGEKNAHIHLCSGCHNPSLMEIDFDLLIQQGLFEYSRSHALRGNEKNHITP
jgi:hypothetical protein